MVIAPCMNSCPQGTDIRAILSLISQGELNGQSQEETFEKAWRILTKLNPLPAVCGSVCPHPCEDACNLQEWDNSVAFNNIERFLGEWAISHNLKHRKLTDALLCEKIAVIGSGPAGLSCAYHLTINGYKSDIFEAYPESGGMLRYGIPAYRLPRKIIDAEIQNILDLGIDIKYNTIVGKDVLIEDLKADYNALFLSSGAHQGVKLYCAGEDAKGVYTGVEFLHLVNSGHAPDIGKDVVVIGGGDTAIDAARMARRLKANATILYRRTKKEMPAIDAEINGAIEEGVKLLYLSAPKEIVKSGDNAIGILCQKMKLGEPDKSGRRRPIPIPDTDFEIPASAIISAVSQVPSWTGLGEFPNRWGWLDIDEHCRTEHANIYAGGDVSGLGLVTTAIAQGRKSAENIKAFLRNNEISPVHLAEVITPDRLTLTSTKKSPRHIAAQLAVDSRLDHPDAEIKSTFKQIAVIEESKRCLGCGSTYVKPKTNLIRIIRRFTQFGIGTILFNSYFQVIQTKQISDGMFRNVCVPGLNCHACPTAQMGCPIGILQYFSATHQFPWFLIGFLGIIGLLSGRFTCGWLCPFGFVQDMMHFLKKVVIPIPKIFHYLKYVILVVLVIIIPFFTFEHWFSKLCPCGALIAGIPWGLWNPEDPVFGGPTIANDAIGSLYWLKMWILGVFLVLFLYIKRPFCRTICPLGAIYAFFNKISLVSLRVKPTCSDCGQCRDICPMDLNPAEDINTENCIKCLECAYCEHIEYETNMPWLDNSGLKGKISIQTRQKSSAMQVE